MARITNVKFFVLNNNYGVECFCCEKCLEKALRKGENNYDDNATMEKGMEIKPNDVLAFIMCQPITGCKESIKQAAWARTCPTCPLCKYPSLNGGICDSCHKEEDLPF
jgi:hypothetical protein